MKAIIMSQVQCLAKSLVRADLVADKAKPIRRQQHISPNLSVLIIVFALSIVVLSSMNQLLYVLHYSIRRTGPASVTTKFNKIAQPEAFCREDSLSQTEEFLAFKANLSYMVLLESG